jgi:hypothetical protein
MVVRGKKIIVSCRKHPKHKQRQGGFHSAAAIDHTSEYCSCCNPNSLSEYSIKMQSHPSNLIVGLNNFSGLSFGSSLAVFRNIIPQSTNSYYNRLKSMIFPYFQFQVKI